MKIFNLCLFAVFCFAGSGFVFAKIPDLVAESGYVFDGDTFAAKVHLENNIEISVRVRIMNIDAPEISGECESEIERAKMAKIALEELLPNGTKVILSKIKDDRYLGRIDAYVKLSGNRDIGKIMMDRGLAMPYNGGKRQGWCKE